MLAAWFCLERDSEEKKEQSRHEKEMRIKRVIKRHCKHDNQKPFKRDNQNSTAQTNAVIKRTNHFVFFSQKK
jgi:hypothetical protein